MPKQSLELAHPLMNAAGSLGFFPDPRSPVNLDAFGAFVTNPISRKARKPPRGSRLQSFPGGALLHTGHPNPGLNKALKKYQGRWGRACLPIIVHLMGKSPEDLQRMILRLEENEHIMAVELGFPADIDGESIAELLTSAAGELPLIARLPLRRACDLAEVARQSGASAVSLSPPRGALTGEKEKLDFGRLYGPAIFPQALETVQSLSAMGIPVIGGGGVYQPEQAEAMLAAGALAVQLDTVLWRSGWPN